MSHILPDNWLEWELESLAQLAPVQWLDWPFAAERQIRIGLKREDLLHPHLGGNKLYKLHGHLRAARDAGCSHILSFGGAWSNHVYALAAAGKSLGLETTAVIRGERPAQLSAMLMDVQAMGMRLYFVSRQAYRQKSTPEFMKTLHRELGPFYAIPEGGGDVLGAEGLRSLGRALAALQSEQLFDVVCCATGTGSTLAGLAAGLPENVTVCGFSVLKGSSASEFEPELEDVVENHVAQLGGAQARWILERRFHGGGYARYTDELAQFVQTFELQTGVLLDPVYTAKMVWGIAEKALLGDWLPGTRILALHSGGLQGRRGFRALAGAETGYSAGVTAIQQQ